MMCEDVWPAVGEEVAIWAAMRGLIVDIDWLGRTLLPAGYGLLLPRTGLSNPFRSWAAVEAWAGQYAHPEH